jgi:hypothetical protein
MAAGLNLLGRGGRQRGTAVIHVFAAAVGGALGGAALGAIGAALMLQEWWMVTGAAVLAIWVAIRRPRRPLGIHRQVPRQWLQVLGERRAYAAWGAVLGMGTATVIPYSAYVVLVAVQLVSGPVLGALAGAAFGISREALALVSAARLGTLSEITDLLPRFRRTVARFNIATILAVGLWFTGVRWL